MTSHAVMLTDVLMCTSGTFRKRRTARTPWTERRDCEYNLESAPAGVVCASGMTVVCVFFVKTTQGFQGKTGPPGPPGVVGPQVSHAIPNLLSSS